MERLEAKQVHGQTYYYYSKWAWVDGKCRRVWQKYLGKLENIAKAIDGVGPAPLYAEVFLWGLPTALWRQCEIAQVVREVNRLCPKRDQGLSAGDYIAIAAINRAICPHSKRSMWEWFSKTVLLRKFPEATEAMLSSQRFWDHMDRIHGDAVRSIWSGILRGVAKEVDFDMSSVLYDGTNFYTFIDTFNLRCEIAKRGKNKQGRDNLRQVSYALFCSADGHIPLFFDVYEGSRNDAKQFPLMLERFHGFFRELSGGKVPETTVVFDKGNNSEGNFALLDSLQLNFVGSVKLDEHKELTLVSNGDPRFVACSTPGLEDSKAFRVNKHVYGKERTLVVTYNQGLFDAQWLTLLNDIQKAIEKLSLLCQKLERRVDGTVTHGKAPTMASVEKQCKNSLSRQHLKRIIKVSVTQGSDNIPRLEYSIDTETLDAVADTYLGKNILVTDRAGWDNDKIIKAYRSQFMIEDVFKEMKGRRTGSWWPLYHWTDSKIKVHALYCTIALLLRALAWRRITNLGPRISIEKMLSELDAIREVVNIHPAKRGQKGVRRQTVLTKTSELQQQLISILGLEVKTMH